MMDPEDRGLRVMANSGRVDVDLTKRATLGQALMDWTKMAPTDEEAKPQVNQV